MDNTGPDPRAKEILITGAAGFIGSHLCEKLLDQGHRVIGIDHMIPDTWIKEKNTNGIIGRPGFTFIKADLLNIDLCSLLSGVDIVFHLAATPGVRTSWGEKFISYLNNNILSTQHLLEAVKGGSLEKFILASTSSIYGTVNGPTLEEHFPRPLSPYGVTKLAAEQLAAIYHREFGLPLTVLRFFTVYGPRQRPDMAFHRFVKSILSDTEITVFGDGGQVRDFTYVADIVDGNIRAMHFPKHGTVFNLGGQTRASVNEIIKMLEQITDRSAKISFRPTQPGDPKETWADITKAAGSLCYSPNTALEDGLAAEVSYIKDLYRL